MLRNNAAFSAFGHSQSTGAEKFLIVPCILEESNFSFRYVRPCDLDIP